MSILFAMVSLPASPSQPILADVPMFHDVADSTLVFVGVGQPRVSVLRTTFLSSRCPLSRCNDDCPWFQDVPTMKTRKGRHGFPIPSPLFRPGPSAADVAQAKRKHVEQSQWISAGAVVGVGNRTDSTTIFFPCLRLPRSVKAGLKELETAWSGRKYTLTIF